MNTIMRTIGGSLGGQITATVVAGHVIAGTALPAESGFTIAFVISAVGVGARLLRRARDPGAASLLGSPGPAALRRAEPQLAGRPRDPATAPRVRARARPG